MKSPQQQPPVDSVARTAAPRAGERAHATRLLEILEGSLSLQREILGAIRLRRQAVRQADFAALERLAKGESSLAARVAGLEDLRKKEVAQVAARLGLPTQAALRDISAHLGETERAKLDLVRSELRATIEEIQREGSVVRQASERLSAHMAGILQTVHSALAHAKVYSRAGAIALGPNVVSSLDIKS